MSIENKTQFTIFGACLDGDIFFSADWKLPMRQFSGHSFWLISFICPYFCGPFIRGYVCIFLKGHQILYLNQTNPLDQCHVTCSVWSWSKECPHPNLAHYRKIPKNSDTRKIAVIILKIEQCGSVIELWGQTMQKEWQTVKTLIRSCLIWVFTVCINISVRKLSIITVSNVNVPFNFEVLFCR